MILCLKNRKGKVQPRVAIDRDPVSHPTQARLRLPAAIPHPYVNSAYLRELACSAR